MKSDTKQMTIYAGRHLGWWIEGRGRSGHRFMWTWWPTKGLATVVARFWARLAWRLAGTEISVAERHATTPGNAAMSDIAVSDPSADRNSAVAAR